MNKQTIINVSTRQTQQTITINYPNNENYAPMTKNEYLNGILEFPGQGTKIEAAYSQIPLGCRGSVANGVFL